MIATQPEIIRCPDCGDESERLEECSVCGKSACAESCVSFCDCGCDSNAHEACMAAWETDAKGRKIYWRKECLLSHAAGLEADAEELLEVARRARKAAGDESHS